MKYSEWGSVVEYVANNLLKEIDSGAYQPDERLPTEREICERYKVGRSSAREALRILEVLGRIRIVRGKGAFVTLGNGAPGELVRKWYDEHEEIVNDIIQARAYLEPAVVSRLAEQMTREQLGKLEKICDELDVAYAENNILGVIALDEKYHITLIDFLGNSVLSDFNSNLQKRSSYYRGKTYIIPKFFNLAQEGHRKILEHLREGDGQAASDELYHHIINAIGYFREVR